jgi:hypothetical protein
LRLKITDHVAPIRIAIPVSLAVLFLSHFGRRTGLVHLRQTFVRRCQWRWRCGSPGSNAICGAGAVARKRTHRRKRPRPGAGGRARPGPKFAERIEHRPRSLCMWERCWRRSHFLSPISSGRYRLVALTPFRGFVR